MPGDISMVEQGIKTNRNSDLGTPIEKTPKPKGALERGGGSGGPRSTEISPSTRSILEIEAELENLANRPRVQPNDPRVLALKNERDTLYLKAKEWGIIDDLKRTMLERQKTIGRGGITYIEVQRDIATIDTDALEHPWKRSSLGTTTGTITDTWDPRLDGILGVYRDIAVLTMDRAWMEAEAALTRSPFSESEAENLRRQVRILEFAPVPREIFVIAREEVAKEVENNQPRRPASPPPPERPDRAGNALERIAPPGNKIREEFLRAERYGMKPNPARVTSESIIEGLENADEITFWRYRLQLANARANKQAAIKVEEVFGNADLMGLSIHALDTLTNANNGNHGVAEVVCIYAAIFSGHEVAGVNIIGATDESKLDETRLNFSSYLEDRFGFSQAEAISYEQIAFNFLMITNFVEGKDPNRELKLSTIFNSPLRDMMHPQLKLEDAVRKKDVWPANILGEWANHHRSRILGLIRIGNPLGQKIQLLPDYLFGSFLDDKNGLEISGNKAENYLVGRGIRLLKNGVHDAHLDWTKANETPFTVYHLKTVNNAVLVFNTILTGNLPPDKNFDHLRQAYKNLGTLTKEMKKMIVYVLHQPKIGWLNPRSKKFQPKKSIFFMSAFWSQFKKQNPSYFD